MADKKNTEVPPASEPPAPVETAAPVTVVRERRRWAMPLISALVIVAALVVGGIGGYAIAAATDAGGRPVIQQGQFPGQQQGPLQGPGQQGDRPDRPNGDTDDTDDSTEDDTTEEDSTEG